MLALVAEVPELERIEELTYPEEHYLRTMREEKSCTCDSTVIDRVKLSQYPYPTKCHVIVIFILKFLKFS